MMERHVKTDPAPEPGTVHGAHRPALGWTALACTALVVLAGAGRQAAAGGEPGDPLGPLSGADWRLVELGGAPAPATDQPVTLGYEDGRIAGFAGCNRYFANVEAGDGPGAVRIGPAGATRMACPGEAMDLEARYLAALAASREAEVDEAAGTLRLRGAQDGPLVFTRARP